MNVSDYNRKLEGILREHLSCNYTEFGVKANGHLEEDWRSPINFALGYKYASSKRNLSIKDQIDYFLGNIIEGNSAKDLVQNFDEYGYESKENALDKVGKIIDEVEKILKSEVINGNEV